MTNLTSEQYRDVLRHVDKYTKKVPSVQVLLRTAVATFFERFGAYPEVGGVGPGKISIFGEQTQFDGGMALPSAIPLSTIIVGRRVSGSRFAVVTAADVGKPHKLHFSFSRKRPLGPGSPPWLNYVKGVIDNYKEVVPAFEAAIVSSIPMGVGFGSSSALETALYSFLEILVGKTADAMEKAKACQRVDKDFVFRDVGLLDRITSILAKDRHMMLVDCSTNSIEWIPFNNPEVALIAVDSHQKDTLLGYEYPESSKYIAKACQMLNVTSLKDCDEGDIQELQNRVNRVLASVEKRERQRTTQDAEKREEKEDDEQEGEDEDTELPVNVEDIWTKEEYEIMIKRATFFVTEIKRIREALMAWKEGDLDTFGRNMRDSHKSLKEDFQLDNPLLSFLVDTSLEVEGVLGSKMTGMGLGLGGGIISMVKKESIKQYCEYVQEKFAANQAELSRAVMEHMAGRAGSYEVRRKVHSEHYNPAIASSEQIGKVQAFLEDGGVPRKVSSKSEGRRETGPARKAPCIVKVERPAGGCGTWGRYQKDQQKQEFLRKISVEEKTEEKPSSTEKIAPKLIAPDFYIVSPFPGTRKMFVTKTDVLRSLFSRPVPQPKALVRAAMEEFAAEYGDNKVEAIGVAPGTLTLFGEFMEFHLGYIICMALPLVTVTVGGRSDSVHFSVKTTSDQVEEPKTMKKPVPCVRTLDMEARTWVNFVLGCVNEFKGHVPGFNAVVSSTVPIQSGLNSCSALQASVYTFLENLTGNCTTDLFEKADRCAKSEYEFQQTPSELVTRCSTIKFFPTFLCKEGHLMFVNCKRYKISHYFFDHPSYAFLIASCKTNTTHVTIESLDDRLKVCVRALEILARNSLLDADLTHLRCLQKRDAPDEVISRAKYVITEHHRTIQAVRAIKEGDYQRVGLLMNQSHASLRDDYGVSSPELDSLVSLALKVDGVLGAKMLGRGLNATVIILLNISSADNCMKYLIKNYQLNREKPTFYVVKPSGGAFSINPIVQMPLVP